MFAIRKVQTRPSVNVQFWTAESLTNNTDYMEYFVNTYAKTGKFLYADNQLSKDKLQLTVVTYWKDQATCDEFKNDPQVKINFLDAKAAYFAQVGITEELVSYESIAG